MIRRAVGVAAVVLALVATSRCNDNNNVTGLQPTLTRTPPGAATSTPTPPGATATPPGPTMTPTPPTGGNATVNVGAGGGNAFIDQGSGTSTTRIGVGSTVNWVWVS